MSSLFAEDAVIRRVGREGVLVLGGGRALSMQLAHPAVAAAVADHSDFESDPMKRLRATLEATYTIVFGTDEAAATTADVIKRVHDRVNGPTYRASDPALLCWVNATLTDTALRVLHESRQTAQCDRCEPLLRGDDAGRGLARLSLVTSNPRIWPSSTSTSATWSQPSGSPRRPGAWRTRCCTRG